MARVITEEKTVPRRRQSRRRGEDSPEEKTVPKKRRTIVKRTAVPKKRTTGPE